VGTRIDLWLPASDMPAPEAAMGDVLPQPDFSGRVLVVDDEDAVRVTTCSMLGELGIATVDVATAEEAEALLRGGISFDLVLTDHLMPGMTGAELARIVRSTWPRLPVLLVSGYADAKSIDIDTPRLTKPFREADLARALADIGFPRASPD
jgi:CheY-like chemotaxis protein